MTSSDNPNDPAPGTPASSGRHDRRAVWLATGVVVVALGLIGALLWVGHSGQRELVAAYTLVAPTDVAESGVVARAILNAGAECPTVDAVGPSGDQQVAMTVRAPAPTAAPVFDDITVCTAVLPVGLSEATVDGRNIPAAMPEQVDELAIFADSGCRVDDKRIQDCNDPDGWPFAQIARNIAAAQPDLILDPGDYYYREMACPAGQEDLCGGTVAPVPGFPFDESDAGWLQDVIEPMQSMFPVAPMAMLRGNHEDCGRAGNGFFLFFDPRPGTEGTCAPVERNGELVRAEPQTTPSWSFDLPLRDDRTLRVAMVDSAYGSDKELTPWVDRQRGSYREADALTTPEPGVESWLVTHRPLFALISASQVPTDDPLAEPWSSDGQMVAAYGLLGNYQMILASHNHYVQSVQIPGQPGALIMGNGGALLDPSGPYAIPPTGPLAFADGTPMVPGLEPYPTATHMWTRVQYGYALARPGDAPGSWTIDQYEFDGTPLGVCQLADRTIECV
ncbi:MAG: hypothetical protein FJW94_13625 [Actinobacteria bacterium]|nr:hypothetical protein [Actinomycetota bacterium]